MPTYVIRKGRIMAKVQIRPIPPTSKTFGTMDEARQWAEETEAAFKERKGLYIVNGGLSVPSAKKAPLTKAAVLKLPRLEPRSAQGVYFLFRGDECVYVGKSKQVHVRIREHRLDKVFDSYSWIPCEAGDLDRSERFYVELLHPEYNFNFVRASIRKTRGFSGVHKRIT